MIELSPALSPLGRIVQRHDPDRFFTALFAPPARRETLFRLYAVNHELARAREVVSNPMLALIRLQWWREVAEGARRRHEVAGPLGEALDDGRLLRADILQMIEGREAEVEAVPDLAAFKAYVSSAYGSVAVAAGRALGGGGPSLEALRALGAAYGASGILRSVGGLARQGRCVLPVALLADAGLTEAEVIADPDEPRLRPVTTALAQVGSEWLAAGRQVRLPRQVLAAALPAAGASAVFRRPLSPPRDALAYRVRVIAAAARGRL